MKLIDTREQKSPRFLMDEFPEMEQITLPTGDLLSKTPEKTILIELKLGKDFGIHTEQLERFRSELYRMNEWVMKGKKRDIHAIWMIPHYNKHEFDIFHHYCHDYYCRAHIVMNEGQLVSRLKNIFNGEYERCAPAIKRIHKPVSTWVKQLCQWDGITLEKAISISEDWTHMMMSFQTCDYPAVLGNILDQHLGVKKDGMSKKLTKDILEDIFVGGEQ